MCRLEAGRPRIALRRTTALREAANYGLRGWISTRSNDPARMPARTIPGRFVRGRIVQHFPVRRNALGFYQGSAGGMKMSKGQTGWRLLGLAVAGVALLTGGAA